MGKGSKNRITNKKLFDENYERIYNAEEPMAYRTDQEFYICKICKRQDERSSVRKKKKTICMDCRAAKRT